MRSTQAFTKENYDKNREVIIYGATVYGEIAYWALEYIGIRPDYFCDRALGGDKKYGIQILSPQELTEHKDAIIILASFNYFYEIKENCKSYGCNEYYDMEYLLQLPLPEDKLSGRAKGRLHDINGYRNMLEHGQGEGRLNINHIDYVVCESCSLKCRDCSNLMQYYKHPEIVDIDKYEPAFARFLSVMDYISEIYILGGEPFLNKEIYKIMDRYHDHPKIGGITIFTNGTIIPDVLTIQSMRKSNVLVQISDYGLKQQKLRELGQVLLDNGVRYVVKKYENWTNLGGIKKRMYSAETLQKNYELCFWKKNYTMLRGKIHNCPRSAHGQNLCAFEAHGEEYVDFNDGTVSHEDLRIQMLKLIECKKYLTACEYCDGGDWNRESIPAAIQMGTKGDI
ncbi:radical SAM protein [Anaerocolumna xylanovorans]|uniref:4Fe-4S single cluster domain-containing protein n=1 Tax=Anaerocolumna xylanovorans DSM 12503 TaxID=1121345 RepID=A0A1M7Y821_9FIRM|nr:radical SAM protein [Anaerocolumna xylanovorans]SHO48785.1 4Fe-4S single cluster domain-containing protein [Anaerocolumna xylanovorans DSM 12503]